MAATISPHPGPFPEDTGSLILIDRPSAQTSTASRPRRTTAAWPLLTLRIVALAAIVLVIFVRIRLRNVPLERDEGEYAYTGQLMLQGIPPFRLASNMKLPGTDAAYAVSLALFGQSPSGVHMGLLAVNLGAVILVFFLGRRLLGEVAAWVAAAAYAVISAGIMVLGTSAHATHFVVLPALAATLLLLRWKDSRRLGILFLSGLLYGLAFLMKQPGAPFAVFGVVHLFWTRRRDLRGRGATVLREFGVFVVACSLPFVITCLLLWHAGVFPKFWFWTVSYARAYGSIRHLSWHVLKDLFLFVRSLVYSNFALWFLAALGGVLIWCKQRYRSRALWMTAFLAFSCLAVCPGFYFRPHYFVLLLPAMALLTGAGVQLAGEHVPKPLVLAVLALAFVVSGFMARRLFLADNTQTSRLMYGLCPFPESQPIADYIRTHTAPDARIVVLGSEPQIYFYASRHSATDYIYTYALVEPQPYALQMQHEMIRDIENADPEYMVEAHVYDSWLVTQNSPRLILDWFAGYWPKHYDLVGVVDMISKTHTVYRWGQAAIGYQPQSHEYLRVFKRR